MITLLISILISLTTGTNPQPTNTGDTTTAKPETQTISTFGGATTWTD